MRQRSKGSTVTLSDAHDHSDHYKLFESSCYEIMRNDNKYILTGFREETSESYSACFWSLFGLHNDSMNVWTHVAGFLFMAYLIVDAFIYEPLNRIELQDKLAFSFFLGFSGICFLVSSIYHLFRSHSVRAYILLLTCDIVGITFQIFSSTILLVYFEMWCFPTLQKMYFSVAVFLAFVTAFYVPYLVRFRKTSMRTFLLTCFALMGIVAWVHHYLLSSLNPYNIHTFKYLVGTYAWILLGLIIRRIQIPEVLKPGWFDIWAGSHQIFHTFTVLASYTLYLGYRNLFSMTTMHECKEGVYF